MKSFFLAIGFFTRLPVPKMEFSEERYAKAMKLIPLVGLVIGAIIVLLALFINILGAPVLVRGAVLMCAYIFLTGGLHFDGLADTCDGVFSGRSRERSLEIMKDSRIGVFGVLSLVMSGLLYFALFTAAPPAALLVFPLCGRACCLISASLAPYAREEGMGKMAGVAGGPAAVVASLVSLIGASFLTIPFLMIPFVNRASGAAEPYANNENIWGAFECSAFLPVVSSLIAAAIAIIATVCITSRFKKKLGGVTGDTFGAVIEVSGISYLLAFTVLNPAL